VTSRAILSQTVPRASGERGGLKDFEVVSAGMERKVWRTRVSVLEQNQKTPELEGKWTMQSLLRGREGQEVII